MRAYVRFNSPSVFCIKRWKVAGALQSPKGIRRNSYTPRLPTVKAVYWRDSSFIFTCQKPLFKLTQEKCLAPTIASIDSCILGRGYESFLVLSLSFLKSIQKCSVPSFFQTSTTALHHGDCDG